jgi:hypothetical protein
MDVSQMRAAQAQAAQGQHNHRMTIGDRISQMASAIDDAVTAGVLSGDQAVQMKKTLGDITKILNHNSHKQNGSNNQTGSSTQLSENDREKIRSDLQELDKQVSAALNPQGAAGVLAARARGAKVDDLFKAIDTNGDGKIRKDELTAYVNKAADSGQSGKAPFSTYGRQGSMTMSLSITTIQFSITT